jgi:peptidoglycan/xylan/chitin deacetylase (PgdA/CDA1 family)
MLPRPLAAAGRATRAVGAWLANRIDAPVAILVYHRVCRLDQDPQQLAVDPTRFAAQLAVLRSRFAIARFEDDWSALRRPAVVVTFDDGYADNLHQALPVLERQGVPATFFITTGAIESQREFWWDELERHLLGAGPRPPRFERSEGGDRVSSPTASRAEREALYWALQPKMKRLLPERRESWLEALRAWSGEGGAPRPTHRPLTADELRLLAASPLATLGAHSVTHTALSALPPDRQRQEISAARQQLEGWLARPVTVASFPFGGRDDFDAASLRITREAGLAKNAANMPGCAHRWSDPHRLPRHLVRDWDGPEFARRLPGFFLT